MHHLLLACLVLIGLSAVEESPPATPPAGGVGIIRLTGNFERDRLARLGDAIERAQTRRLGAVIIQVQSLGGSLAAGQEALKRILDLAEPRPRLIGWVDAQVLGPAALVVLACDEFWMTDTATAGAVALGADPDGRQAALTRSLLTSVASKRNRPRSLLLKLAIREPALYRLSLPGSSPQFLFEDEVKPTMAAAKLEVDRETREGRFRCLVSQNTLLSFNGSEGQDLGLVAGLERDLASLCKRLQVPETALVDLLAVPSEAPPPAVAASGPLMSKDLSRSAAKPAALVPQRVGKAEIKEAVIDRLSYVYLKRVITEAHQKGLDTLILHLTTDGGRVDYARKMLELVLNEPTGDKGLRTVAFIDSRALSAGAMIALGHERIYIKDTARIGDIGVISQGSDGKIEYAPEKIVTEIRTILVSTAQKRGWDPALVQKMTDRDRICYQVVMDDGAKRWVMEPDLAQVCQGLGIDPSDRERVIPRFGKDHLLNLTGKDAVEMGVATGLVQRLEDVYADLGVQPAQVVDLAPTAHERIAWELDAWAPLFAGLAVLLILLQFKLGGTGVWLILAGTSFMAFLFCRFYSDMVNSIELILLVAGLIAVAVDLVTGIGGGFLAVGGMLMALAGLFMANLPNEVAPTDNGFWDQIAWATGRTMASLCLAVIGLVVFFAVLPHTSFMRRVALAAEIEGTSGGTLEAQEPQLIGQQGRTCCALHPCGTVALAGCEHSARSVDGLPIAKGASVEVVGVAMGELVVRRSEPPQEVRS